MKLSNMAIGILPEIIPSGINVLDISGNFKSDRPRSRMKDRPPFRMIGIFGFCLSPISIGIFMMCANNGVATAADIIPPQFFTIIFFAVLMTFTTLLTDLSWTDGVR